MALTRNQQQAVEHDGHLLIVAGPGSGKTSTSIAKAERILADPQRSLIMVTFTREGASEMQRRLAASFKQAGKRYPDESRLIIATFHSLSIKHLFRHTPRCKVMSPGQQSLTLSDAANSCNFAPKTPEQDDERDARQGFETYQYTIDRSRMRLEPRQEALTMRLVHAYEQRLSSSGMMDLYTVMRDCALRAQDGSLPLLPYTDMLVDEAQDTDDLQRAWIFAHARGGCNVSLVGDDDQSIYEWRQALGYQGMRSFLETFSARRVELGDNFRCRAEVLKHAVHLIEHNEDRLGKTLVAQRGKGGAIFAIPHIDDSTQYRQLSTIIKATPKAHVNAAILARNNMSLDNMELELRGDEIEYKRVGKSIWENYYIAGYIGLLNTLLDGNPVGLLQALHLRGLSQRTKSELIMLFKGNASSFLDGHVPPLDTATPADIDILKHFAKDSSYWRRQLHGNKIGGSATEIVLDVGLSYAAMVPNVGQSRLLEKCAEILSKLKGSLTQRLRIISQRGATPENCLVLMTMHGSKGLEFDTVHVIDAIHKDAATDARTDESERRLMYVAITRAKEVCSISYHTEAHSTIAEAAIADMRDINEVIREIDSRFPA